MKKLLSGIVTFFGPIHLKHGWSWLKIFNKATNLKKYILT